MHTQFPIKKCLVTTEFSSQRK